MRPQIFYAPISDGGIFPVAFLAVMW